MIYTFLPHSVRTNFEEIHPSWGLTCNEHGLEIRRTYRCAWADRFTLVKELYGRGQSRTSSGQSDVQKVTVRQPHRITIDLDEQNKIYLFCTAIAPRGFFDSSGGDQTGNTDGSVPDGQGTITYDYAEVDVTYSSRPWFCEYRMRLGGEVIAASPPSGGAFYWHSDHDPLDKQLPTATLRVPTGILEVSFKCLKYVPDCVFSMRGHINEEAMRIPRMQIMTDDNSPEHKEFDAGEVLYDGADVSEVQMPAPMVVNPINFMAYSRVDMTLLINENGWNKFLRPDTGEWDSIDTDEAGTTPYEPYGEADLRKLVGRM